MRILKSLFLCAGLLAVCSAQAQTRAIRITPLNGTDFGAVPIGSSHTLTFDVDMASGTDQLRSLVQTLTPGDMWGGNPAPGFALNLGGCSPGGGVPGGTSLGPGWGCRFTVTFTPTATGAVAPYVIATTHYAGVWATLPLTAAGGTGQTITFTSTPSPSAYVGGPSYSLAATATSGLPVSFSVDPASSAVCSLIGGAYVDLIAPGSCIVYANQAGDATYAPAPRVGQTFTVMARPLPVATADSYTTPFNTALTVPAASGVLSNDNSPLGLPLGAVLTAGPAHGTITLYGDGAFTYTPNAGFAGADAFSYRANDGADSLATTVSLTVSAAVTPAGPASIPTLSEWGLIGLSSLVGLFALGRVRRRAE